MTDCIKTSMRTLLIAGLIATATSFAVTGAALAAGGVDVPKQDWTFKGPFGKFDRGQLQRGYKVYKEVCASCHSMSLLSFRNLGDAGGPEFPVKAVEALAAEATVQDGPNEDGDMFDRPGKPADRFPSPFANEQAARASNNGAYPPDLSVIAKARVGGPDYLYALLSGYVEAPADVQLREGMSYNKYFPGHQIAMAAPLFDEGVEYTDGSPMTVDQYARDVSAFLMWAAEPKLEARHKMGLNVVLFLIVFAGLLYATKRKVWSQAGH